MLLLLQLPAQFVAPRQTLDAAQYAAVEKVAAGLLASPNLVFHLPCNHSPDWNKNLAVSSGITWGEDRYQKPNEAIVFAEGHNGLLANRGQYFKDNFAISAWVNIDKVSRWSRILDFGNGKMNCNVVFAPSLLTTSQPAIAVYKGRGPELTLLQSPEMHKLQEGRWYHLATTLDNHTARLYINGIEVAKAEQFNSPGSINRDSCWIGRSDMGQLNNFLGRLDDLRIYDRALNDWEIKLLADWTFVQENTKQVIALVEKPQVDDVQPKPIASNSPESTQANGAATNGGGNGNTGSGGSNQPVGDADSNGNDQTQSNPTKPITAIGSEPAAPKPVTVVSDNKPIASTPALSTGAIRSSSPDSVLIDSLVAPAPNGEKPPHSYGKSNIVTATNCPPAKYKLADFEQFSEEKDVIAAINNYLATEGKAGWKIRGDVGGMAFYQPNSGITGAWEHVFLMGGQWKKLDSLGAQGWEFSASHLFGMIFSRPAEQSKRQVWEYKVAKLIQFGKNERVLAANKETVTEQLDSLGHDGWEIMVMPSETGIFKRPKTADVAQRLVWTYDVIDMNGVENPSSLFSTLGLSNWAFGAVPMEGHMGKHALPVVVKHSGGGRIVPLVYTTCFLRSMSLGGGGNAKAFSDANDSIAQYAAKGWEFVGTFEPSEIIGKQMFALLFAAPHSCYAKSGTIYLGLYHPKERGMAYLLSNMFGVYVRRIAGIIPLARSHKALAAMKLEYALTEAGLVKAETQVKNNMVRDNISIFFTDLENGAVQAIVKGAKGEKVFQFAGNERRWDLIHAQYDQMVAAAWALK